MVRTDFGISKGWLVCCLVLFFLCAALSTRVKAAEESGVLSPTSVKVYGEMSEESDVAANLIAGNIFDVLEAESDGAGVIWYRIKTDFGAEGYVKADELELLLMETQALQQNVEDNAADAGGDAISDAGNTDNTVLDNAADTAALDSTVTVTDNAASGNADVESNAAVGKLITQDSVNLRSLPSAESEILTKINQNTELSYFERSENSDGEGWYQVVYNDLTGYVIESAVTLVQESAEEAQTTVETVEAKEEASREETQSESEADDSARAEFEVSETGTAQKSRSGGGIDMVLVLLIAGGILCIAAIIVFLRKILALLRE